ncbi:hypothetical protein EK21DRAFT_118503 [Setomelanomma holmii]|uniref:Uncharacterized protein n=1 Tax=Setomelanomma holmii TaxID=210430 RepID=A0A9P4GXB9_9PLEO|nr:hypothetical protein EK21DRAFT_118503 [Setomelanomma holmii]
MANICQIINDLPQELKLMIFRLCLLCRRPITPVTHPMFKKNLVSIAKTSKAVRISTISTFKPRSEKFRQLVTTSTDQSNLTYPHPALCAHVRKLEVEFRVLMGVSFDEHLYPNDWNILLIDKTHDVEHEEDDDKKDDEQMDGEVEEYKQEDDEEEKETKRGTMKTSWKTPRHGRPTSPA